MISIPLLTIGFLTYCNNDTKEEENYSSLIGTFTFDRSIKQDAKNEDLRIYNTLDNAVDNNLYTSNVYPLNTVNGTKVCYSYQQSLKLNRNFSYRYVYSITLTNSEEWGKDFAMINVEMEGTFSFVKNNEYEYAVTLSNPTSGLERLYGCTISAEGSVFAWTLSNVPSKEVDIAKELSLNENYNYSRFTKGRNVVVERRENERILTDNIFYYDVLNDLALYCDYSF